MIYIMYLKKKEFIWFLERPQYVFSLKFAGGL
jgi:hypothetical protein